MKPLLMEQLPTGPGWIYEIKFDGIRALAVRDGGSLSLLSRAGNNLAPRFPELVEVLRKVRARRFVMDGELVALDSEGRPSFQLLQSFHFSPRKPPLFYYVFDLLNLEGKDLARLPLLQRKELVRPLLASVSPALRFSDSIRADSDRVLREMRARGLEGLIAKKADSCYEPGRRSGAWRKFKWRFEQEFVIGGYTRPKGARTHFGAILVGYYQDGRLLFAAKVGTGFDDRLLASLYGRFQTLIRPDCPFANLPEKPSGSRTAGLTSSQMRLCTWVQPKLVCQIRFAEWTRDYHLRQPAFLALREDKRPEEVVREKPARG